MALFQPYETHYCKLSESYQSGPATRDHVGTLEFIKEPTDTAPRLARANLPWGYITADGRDNAYISDYHGNIRAVVDADGTAIQTTDYYPYDLPMATSTAPAANRYKYGAKELETRNGLNFHDFEARMLFNDHTLFGRPDDKAGKYPHLNPYLYCAANPLRYVDPTGEKLVVADDASEWFINKFTEAYNIMKDKQIDFIITELINREEVITLQQPAYRTYGKCANNFNLTNLTITWDPEEHILSTPEMVVISSVELLSHECDHALQYLKNPEQQQKDKSETDTCYGDNEERRVITGSETKISKILGNITNNETSRNNHQGQSVFIDKLLPTLDEMLENIGNNHIFLNIPVLNLKNVPE